MANISTLSTGAIVGIVIAVIAVIIIAVVIGICCCKHKSKSNGTEMR